MPREGALEGRNGEATLEGGWQYCQRRGLPSGSYGILQVGPQRPSGETDLQLFTQAVERVGI